MDEDCDGRSVLLTPDFCLLSQRCCVSVLT